MMATKTEVENEEVENPLENQNLNTVCKTVQFSDDNMKLQLTRKRCVSTSIIISSSPKKKKKEGLTVIPPKKFLLGGNISDPLNLNSLQNEDINKAMNKTPKTSPLHSNTINIKKDQVNVIIPRNVCDPLELSTCNGVKSIVCPDLDSPEEKSPKKLKPKKVITKSFSDSGLLTENTPENNNLSELFDNTEKTVDVFFSSPIKKKAKIERYEKNTCDDENNIILSTVVEIVEKIKEVLENEVQFQSIDTCSIPIPIPPVEVVVKQLNESCKMLSKPDKVVVDGKEIQEQNKKIKPKRSVVNPVVPQTSLTEKHCKLQQVGDTTPTKTKTKQKINKNEPKFKEKNSVFKYGNYNRYYGYRNPDDEDDRLKVLAERLDLFYGKDVLDIGCNIGHVTFSVARDFGAKSVVGMDIDRKLINIARKNVQYYINDTAQSSPHLSPNYHFNNYASSNDNDVSCDETQLFPISLPMLYGPINLPGLTLSGRFPYNVSFVQGNYVLESDVMLSMEVCKFDVILCLSITKWLHLNWGDEGLKRAFKRMYAQLRPGGILVVEPQPWKSYGRRKSLTETIWRNYKRIELRPPMFTEYLLNEVGFSNCETLPMPHNPSKGFQRPLKLYRKPNSTILRDVPKCTVVRPNETQRS